MLFEQAVALGAGRETQREAQFLRPPGHRPAADATHGNATIWIDISDLLVFLAHNRHLSGIQRVQMALIDHVVANPDEACIVTTLPWDTRIWCLSRQAVRDFHAVFVDEGGGRESMRDAIKQLHETARQVPPAPGSTFFLPGAFWMDGGNPPLLPSIHAAGMRVVPLIYDLIPMRHPAICIPALVEEFQVALGETLREVDGIIAISEHTAADVAALMREHGLPAFPIIPVPLAHRLNETAAGRASWTPQIEPFRDRPFVLTVGTIEPRKNHQLLLGVWQGMVDEGLDPPLLIIAGKRGWASDAFDAEMRLTRAVDGRVKVMSDLSDPELDALYGGCLFTAFPSLAEGWGLPVGESLARGKVCIASNRDSIPEVGGDAAIYVDPTNIGEALPAFRRLLFEPGALAAAELKIRESFQPRSWPEVVEGMMAALRAMPLATPSVTSHGPTLPAGTVFRPAQHLRDPRLDPLEHPLRLMLAEGWERPSLEGAAVASTKALLNLTLPKSGSLQLRFHAEQAAMVRAGDQSLAMPGGTGCMLKLQVAGGPLRLEIFIECDGAARPRVWLTGVAFQPSAHTAQ